MKLTTHFQLHEFVVSQEAARKGIDNAPPATAIANLRKTAQLLEKIRVLVGNRPVVVSSGYRCPKLNALVGGSPTSAHLSGLAADIIIPGLSAYALSKMIAGSDLAFDQVIYEYEAWTHVGLREQPRRQAMSKFHGTKYLTGILKSPIQQS